jgi:uncharacterized protein YaeQ
MNVILNKFSWAANINVHFVKDNAMRIIVYLMNKAQSYINAIQDIKLWALVDKRNL